MKELSARIAGNNLALQRLAAELDEKKPLNAAQLAPMIERLEPLVARRDDLRMFVDMLSLQQRKEVGSLESPADLIAELNTKIAAARKHAQSDAFQGTAQQRATELEMLDALAGKLADLVFESP